MIVAGRKIERWKGIKKSEKKTETSWGAAVAKQIPHLCGDGLPPKVRALGVQAPRHGPERGGLHGAVWKAIGSNPFSDRPPHTMVRCSVDAVTGTLHKMLHELHVARGLFLVGLGPGEHMDGERFPVFFGLACELGSGRNVFDCKGVVRQYVVTRYRPRRVVVRKQISAYAAPDLLHDLARFVLGLYL